MAEVFVCGECHQFIGLDADEGLCPRCGCIEPRRLRKWHALGLIGLPCTGKTVYLATLHDQLMHSAPEWRVEVTDHAFSTLTDVYESMLSGESAPATTKGEESLFLMKVVHQGRNLELLMWDVAGEVYSHLRDDSHCLSQSAHIMRLLLGCRTILVTIDSFHREARGRSDADQVLGRLFRSVLRSKPLLRRVIILLVGVDVYGDNARDADPRALQEFQSRYRIFPGVLKNAGIRVDIVPLSNFGFENVSEQCPIASPRPYNVLEPLRLAFPTYLPRWRRLLVWARRREKAAPGPVVVTSAEAQSRSPAPDPQAAFISYRREADAETARLIWSELRARGWQAFLDVEDLGASRFDDRILLEIQNAKCFIVILSPGCLDRCVQKKDWVRREIAHAISRGRHIVPLVKEGFSFPPEEALPEPIRALPNYNCVKYSNEYFDATMDKLVSFLSESIP